MTYDRGSGPYEDGRPVQPRYQRVLNESWPQRDRTGWHARGIKSADHTIPVTVRVDFEHDGECCLEGTADRWTRTHVHVAVLDERLQVKGVWVMARDVTRR